MTGPDCVAGDGPVDPDTAHWVHGDHWHDNSARGCDCDLYAHPGCCPDCNPTATVSMPGVRS